MVTLKLPSKSRQDFGGGKRGEEGVGRKKRRGEGRELLNTNAIEIPTWLSRLCSASTLHSGNRLISHKLEVLVRPIFQLYDQSTVG